MPSKRKSILLLTILLATGLAPTRMAAQTPEPEVVSNLEGRILTEDGQGVSGALIVLQGSGGTAPA